MPQKRLIHVYLIWKLDLIFMVIKSLWKFQIRSENAFESYQLNAHRQRITTAHAHTHTELKMPQNHCFLTFHTLSIGFRPFLKYTPLVEPKSSVRKGNRQSVILTRRTMRVKTIFFLFAYRVLNKIVNEMLCMLLTCQIIKQELKHYCFTILQRINSL